MVDKWLEDLRKTHKDLPKLALTPENRKFISMISLN